MIQFIIRDFQAIEEAKINVEGLTILIGQSSSGKSACLRAISAAFNNRFKNGQVRHGTEQAVVKAKFSDSPQVFTAIRPWAGSIKMFLDKVPYNKLGRTLPLDISNLINTSNLDVSGEVYSLNFHEQFQKPLLLEFSQKKVMDLLSHSQALDDLQETKDALSEKRLENKGAFKSVDAILSNTKEQLSEVNQKLEKVLPLEQDLDTAITAYESIDKSLESILNLQTSLSEHKSGETKQASLLSLLTQLKSLEDISEDCSSISELQSTVEQRNQNKQSISIFPNMQQFSSNIKEWEHKDQSIHLVEDLSGFVSRCIEQQEKINLNTSILNKLKVLVDKQDELDKNSRIYSALQLLEGNISVHVSQQSRLNQLNDIIVNHICPVCGSKVQ